jgi:BirA family biotin operon repressor/biotin-[acetyl-CoA-carboxylase] ligase
LVGGRKLAGILTEMATLGTRIEHVVVGVGVNVNGTDLLPTATSLRQAAGTTMDPDQFLARLLGHLEARLDRFFAEGLTAVAADWERYAGVRLDPSGALAIT